MSARTILVVLGVFLSVFFQFFNFYTVVFAEQRPSKDAFGVGGSCAIARDLGVGWMYLWGGGRNYPNETEVTCNKSTGILFFFTVGKTDTVVTYADLPQWESQYILPDEREAYAQYKQLVENMAKQVNTRDSALASYVLIPKYIQELGYRGAYYAVGNEPDLERSVSTTEYAQQYKLLHDRIKKYDLTAKIGNGGFLSIVPELGRKLQESDGLDQGANRFAWIDDWRSKYKALYGTDVPIDFWNIHPYVYPANFSANEALDNRVDQFKAYLDRTGEGSKPVWITEYGVLGSEGDILGKAATCQNQKIDGVTQYCFSLEDRTQEHALVAQFMDEVTRGFMNRPYIERWFWFYAGETWSSSYHKLNYPGDIYKYTGETEYNAVGKKYIELIEVLSTTPTPTPAPTPTPTPTPVASPTPTPGPVSPDFNRDAKIDIFDYSLLYEQYGKGVCEYNLTGSECFIDTEDILFFVSQVKPL